MKRITVLIVFLLFSGMSMLAQDPPPPMPDLPPNELQNGPVGGGSPIGSGLVILLALGAGYGGKKVYDFRKKNNSLQEL